MHNCQQSGCSDSGPEHVSATTVHVDKDALLVFQCLLPIALLACLPLFRGYLSATVVAAWSGFFACYLSVKCNRMEDLLRWFLGTMPIWLFWELPYQVHGKVDIATSIIGTTFALGILAVQLALPGMVLGLFIARRPVSDTLGTTLLMFGLHLLNSYDHYNTSLLASSLGGIGPSLWILSALTIGHILARSLTKVGSRHEKRHDDQALLELKVVLVALGVLVALQKSCPYTLLV